MKRRYFIVFLIMPSFLFMNAQSKMGLGIKGGLNVNLHGFMFSEERSLVALHGGIYINYPISKFLLIQSEILLSQKGEKWDEDIMKGKYLLTYIDLPLLMRFHPTPNNAFFNIHAGPQFSYLIRALRVYENELEDDKGKEDIKERYKDFDIGLAIGFEFNFSFHVNFTLRYVHGLSLVSDFYGYDYKNYVLQLSAGYRFLGN
jgi:outer membrane immunogenic protein